MDNALFPPAAGGRPYRVVIQSVEGPLDHFEVRRYLIALGWEEYEDWMIRYDADQKCCVWFKDIAKATYFKVSFAL